MRIPRSVSFTLWVFAAVAAHAQVVLNNLPSRSLGHSRLSPVTNFNPNLVEGRELFAPQGVAVDTANNILYVSDTGNNRVLAFRNASGFSNGAKADLVIGQKDFFSTTGKGPGTDLVSGLAGPTGLAVDKSGNLYVVDSGNNRILRYPTPLAQTELFPDLVIGQPNFTSNAVNAGGGPTPSAKSIATRSDSVFSGSLVFDSNGNLYFTDPLNNRVLRYPATALGATPDQQPAADLVLGQLDFISNQRVVVGTGVDPATNKQSLNIPSGLALDPAGNLFVSDGYNRIAVYAAPLRSGSQITRFLGIVPPAQPGQPPPPIISDSRFRSVDGLVMINNSVAAVDTLNHRIIRFLPLSQWTDDQSKQPAAAVVGQPTFETGDPNRKQPEPGRDRFFGPTDATFVNGDLYVCDTFNNRVIVLPQTSPGFFGDATRVIGQDSFELNGVNLVEGREFNFTAGGADGNVTIDLKSEPPHLYVADTYNNRVLGFRDARKVRSGDKADLVIGQLDFSRILINSPKHDVNAPTATGLFQPNGLVVDPDGNLFVADTGNGRVLRFPKPFEKQVQMPDLVLGQPNFTTNIPDASATKMRAPYGLALDGNGLLVADRAHHRVLWFQGKPTAFTNGMAATKVFGQPDFSSTFAGTTAQDARLNNPHGVAIDPDGRFYVADTGANRFLLYANPTSNLNSRPAVILPMNGPRGVFVNINTGEVWVAESTAGRVVRFRNIDAFTSNLAPDQEIRTGIAPISVVADNAGTLYVGDASNRVAMHFASATAVNAASTVNRPLAPGMIGTIFAPEKTPNQFGKDTATASGATVPVELADLQVLINDVPAPLYYVSPSQINFIVPREISATGGIPADLQVVRKSTGQLLGVGQIPIDFVSPSFFTSGGNGTGQIAALNQDNTPNTPLVREMRGNVLQLYGTGLCPVSALPANGVAPSGAVPCDEKPFLVVNNIRVPDEDLLYAGLAPGLAGVWQINFKIASTTPPANNIPVVLSTLSRLSNEDGKGGRLITTVSVK